MKDDMIAIFGLKASGKGKEAQGNNLYAVDYVRLYLSFLYDISSEFLPSANFTFSAVSPTFTKPSKAFEAV